MKPIRRGPRPGPPRPRRNARRHRLALWLVLAGAAAFVGAAYLPVAVPALAPLLPAWSPFVGLAVALAGALLVPSGRPPLRVKPGRVVPGEEGTSLDAPPVHPAALLDGDELQRAEPRRWQRDPARELGSLLRLWTGCLVVFGLVVLLHRASSDVPSLGPQLLVVEGGVVVFACVVGLPPALELVRGWLAARRLGLELEGAPASLEAGRAVDVEVVLRPRQEVEVGRVRVLLAGTAEFKVVRGGGRNRSTTWWVELLHRAVTELELNERLRPGDERRLRARFEVPRRASPTRERRRGGRTVRWMVAAVAEVPRWPDAAVVREVEVWRPRATARTT